MNEFWYRKARYGSITGTGLLILGLLTFVLSDEGTKIEKIGVFLMTFGGVLLGMGYSAFIASKKILME